MPKNAELYTRLPRQWQAQGNKKAAPSLTTKSPIHALAKEASADMESIIPYLVAPYDQVPPSIIIQSSGSRKKEDNVDKAIKVTSASHDATDTLTCYSDGHMTPNPTITSLGYVIYHGNTRLHTSSRNIGNKATIYDAEILAIALACEKAVEIAPATHTPHIRIFSDNQSAVTKVADLGRHPGQYASSKFRDCSVRHASLFPQGTIHVIWVPGHTGISGNEEADKLAKNGARLPPDNPITSITWLRTNATRNAVYEWTTIWNQHINDRTNSGRFIPRPPSLTLNPVFKPNMPRDLSSRLVQLITEHGFYGEYEARFHPDRDPQCQCGESVQTTIHTTLFCPSLMDKRHILRECSHDLSEKILFGTTPGLQAMVKFIAATGIGQLRRTEEITPDL